MSAPLTGDRRPDSTPEHVPKSGHGHEGREPAPKFRVDLAKDAADIRAAQRVRYLVFVQELGGNGAGVDHAQRLEKDRFDAFADHLLLRDLAVPGAPVVGVYRLMGMGAAAAAGQFYSEDEYDLTRLRQGGRQLLELGRSCLLPPYRGGTALHAMWNGLAAFVMRHRAEILFGTASFHGTDLAALREPLSWLYHRHLAPADLRVRARHKHCVAMNRIPAAEINALSAVRALPGLIKAYLRLGGYVGDGAFVDRAFNTTDVCLVMDTARLNPVQRALYTAQSGR